MEVRNTADINNYQGLSTDELRRSFLLENLFEAGKIHLVYCDADRAIVGSAVPAKNSLKLESSRKEMAADYFAERREIGVINIGGKGSITVDGKKFEMENRDALYIGRGSKDIHFSADDEKSPAKYYIVSYPSHHDHPTTHAKLSDAEAVKLGSNRDANERTIYKFIHQNGIRSSQLVMGFTELKEGSVWNTMPAHTHIRRSEVYMYFNLDEDAAVIHLMGKPDATRHLIIRNEQAVISPSWSIHCGAATQNYSFIWAMGGENQAFDDMDPAPIPQLK